MISRCACCGPGSLRAPSRTDYRWYSLRFSLPTRCECGIPVWVFLFSADQRTWDEEDERKPSLERKPDDLEGKIKMALTMNERCTEMLRDYVTGEACLHCLIAAEPGRIATRGICYYTSQYPSRLPCFLFTFLFSFSSLLTTHLDIKIALEEQMSRGFFRRNRRKL